MKVADIFTPGEIHTCAPETSWKEAASLMLKRRVSAIPVVDSKGTLLGILSEKDLFRAFFPKYKDWVKTPHAFTDFEILEQDVKGTTLRAVTDIMSPRLLTANLETPILKIGALMVASGIHQVPIIHEGKLLGMVSRGNIYRAVLSQYF